METGQQGAQGDKIVYWSVRWVVISVHRQPVVQKLGVVAKEGIRWDLRESTDITLWMFMGNSMTFPYVFLGILWALVWQVFLHLNN